MTMNCTFRNCTEELPEDHPFKLCDKCRIIDMWDAAHICLDPMLPQFPHLASVVDQRILTRLTGEETLQFFANIEAVYLEICKFKKMHFPEVAPKRVKLTLQEQIELGRATNDEGHPAQRIKAQSAEKKKAKKYSVIQKQMRALGCDDDCMGTSACTHEAAAKRIFDADFDL